MDTNAKMKKTNSNVWLYVVGGSALGGALGYLLTSDSGQKVREKITRSTDLADNIAQARTFIEDKARTMAGQIEGVERGIREIFGTETATGVENTEPINISSPNKTEEAV
jgi:hypothetical protein